MLSAVEARWEQNAAEELTLVKMKSRGADFYRPFLWDRRGYILTFFYVLRLRSEEWFNIFHSSSTSANGIRTRTT